ncbi:hypothetical protein GZH46_00261, partial [Fragariocoptes setiger]
DLVIAAPKCIVIDVDQTIGSIDDGLVGSDAIEYVERNLVRYLTTFWNDHHIRRIIKAFKEQSPQIEKILGKVASPENNLTKSIEMQLPKLQTTSSDSQVTRSRILATTSSSDSASAIGDYSTIKEIKAIADLLLSQVRSASISSAATDLFEHVLFEAYDKGLLRVLIFDGVREFLNDARMIRSIMLISLSRGTPEFQRCYFKSTTQGDLTKFFSAYVDYKDKRYQGAELFKHIIRLSKERADNILYIGAHYGRAGLAADAGMNILIVDRKKTFWQEAPASLQHRVTGQSLKARIAAQPTTTMISSTRENSCLTSSPSIAKQTEPSVSNERQQPEKSVSKSRNNQEPGSSQLEAPSINFKAQWAAQRNNSRSRRRKLEQKRRKKGANLSATNSHKQNLATKNLIAKSGGDVCLQALITPAVVNNRHKVPPSSSKQIIESNNQTHTETFSAPLTNIPSMFCASCHGQQMQVNDDTATSPSSLSTFAACATPTEATATTVVIATAATSTNEYFSDQFSSPTRYDIKQQSMFTDTTGTSEEEGGGKTSCRQNEDEFESVATGISMISSMDSSQFENDDSSKSFCDKLSLVEAQHNRSGANNRKSSDFKLNQLSSEPTSSSLNLSPATKWLAQSMDDDSSDDDDDSTSLSRSQSPKAPFGFRRLLPLHDENYDPTISIKYCVNLTIIASTTMRSSQQRRLLQQQCERIIVKFLPPLYLQK